METSKFNEKLKEKMRSFVFSVYRITKKFPKEEMYGVTSQLRRSSLSVLLNKTEGFARSSNKAYKYFLEISYGSLKEVNILLDLAKNEKYMTAEEFELLNKQADEIGAMLWSYMRNINKRKLS